jgi:hypothetical protein
MMTYVARTYVTDAYNEGFRHEIVGRGATAKDAIADCRRQVRAKVSIERISHSGGEPYEWRFFAVRRGLLTLVRRDPDGKGAKPEHSGPCNIGDKPVMRGIWDCNAEYEFRLPKGSREFVDGRWVARHSARYDY